MSAAFVHVVRDRSAAAHNHDEYGGQGSSLDYDDGTAGMDIPNNQPGRKGGMRGGYDSRQIQGGYDARQNRVSATAYYSDDQSYGGAGTASDYGYSDGDQYYPDAPGMHQQPGGAGQQGTGGYGMPAPMRGGGPPRPQPQQDGFFQQPGRGRGGVATRDYDVDGDPYGMTSFSDEEADELDSRLSRFSGRGEPVAEDPRSKSLMRFNELERERSRRRQDIVKYKTGSKLFPGTLKLSMMNTGLIPIKKGKAN